MTLPSHIVTLFSTTAAKSLTTLPNGRDVIYGQPLSNSNSLIKGR